MLKSMTGFGRAEKNVGDKTFLVDIKSLNGKQFDLQLKLPSLLKPFEFDIRRMLSERLGRGTVDCTISLKDTGNAKPVTINTDLAKSYYQPLAELSKALNLDPSHILSTLVKLPEVITPSGDTLTDEEWNDFQNGKWHVSGGAGGRYLIVRKLKLRMGIDIARGPEQWAYYMVFGTTWVR